jgi:hypothetical protein
MQQGKGIRTTPWRALAFALALMAVLLLAGLGGYLVSSLQSSTSGHSSSPSTVVAKPHTSDTSAPAMLQQNPGTAPAKPHTSDTSAPAMLQQNSNHSKDRQAP